MLGLVMQAEHVTLQDLAFALRTLEPICASLCAKRPDRAKAVVPKLKRVSELARDRLDDGPSFTRLARKYHDELVGSCQNTTLILVVGTLESLWSNHEAEWADTSEASGRYPERHLRELVLRTHANITDAVRTGRPEVVTRLVTKHLEETQSFVLANAGHETLSVTDIRSWRSVSRPTRAQRERQRGRSSGRS
jgi:DNA-binding FadR family transcriptional regulator